MTMSPGRDLSNAAVTMFLSCSDEDEELLEELLQHLSSLMREGRIICRYRHQVRAGGEWREQAKRELDAAEIILLLVSPSFVASDYCYGEEAVQAMLRQRSGRAQVIPVIVRPVEWRQLIFGGLKSLPEGESISMWSNKEEALANIVQGVRTVIDDLKTTLRSALRSTEKPLDFWNIPYWRNPCVTGRAEVFADLQRAFTSTQALFPVQVLSGLPGIGKTQVAVEYAYRHTNSYQAALWVRADSPENLLSSFVDLAETLGLPEKTEADQALILRAVKQWLEHNTRWLLIVDNLEDVSLLRDIVPSPHAGHILVTTRARRTGHLTHRVDLKPMPIDEGALLLLRRAKLLALSASLSEASETDSTFAREIARVTDGLPLALDQAGAYIEETGRGLSDYVALYQKYSASLLKRRGTSAGDYPASVTTTFAVSFEKVGTLNAVAVELLKFCAFLHPDAIPEDMLVGGALALPAVLRDAVTDPLELDRAIEDLLKFSLIKRESAQNMLIIHRLVQEVAKGVLNEGQQREYRGRVVRLIEAVFPSPNFSNWTVCQRYLPQAQACAKLVQERNILLTEASQFFCRVGEYLTKRGLYDEAEELLSKALAIEETLSGTDHPTIPPVLNALATVYHKRGKYALVEQVSLRALTLGEKRWGEEHPQIGESLHILARTYHKQGRYAEAEPLFQRALAVRQKVLGPQHPDVAVSLNNLANLYNRQGKYEQAEELYLETLALRQQVLDPRDPGIASTLNNLGVLYGSQEKYEQARTFYEQALAIDEQVLGQEHPNVALLLSNLAEVCQEQGQYSDAEALYQRAFSIFQKSLGAEHPELVLHCNHLARLYFLQGKYMEAEETARQALVLGEKVLGPNHQRVGTSVRTLADISKAQNKYVEAETLYQRALDIYEKAFGLDNINVAFTLEGYASLLQAVERRAEAEVLSERAAAIRSKQPMS